MGSSIKINSISIDLADEVDAGKCEHFSIRGYVAEIRERDHRKCWPFSEDSVELRNHESYSLPSLPALKSRWWRCASCIRDINANEINNDCDFRLQSHSRAQKFDAGSSAIPSKRKPNSLIVTDKKEKKSNVRRVTLLKKVRRRAKDGSTVKSKSGRKPKQVSKKSREKANISREIMEPVTAFGPSDIAGVIDDPPDKAIKRNDRYTHVSAERDDCDNVSPESRNLFGLHRRKTRKVRLLSELLSDRNKEALSKRESGRGRKRKSFGDEELMTNYASRILSTIGKTSENASKSCDSQDNTVSGAESRPSVENQSIDSGFDRETINGKQRNRRFQVFEESFPEASQKDPYDYASPVHSSFAGKELVPCPLNTQITEKERSLAKKRKRKAMKDDKKSPIMTFSNDRDDGNLVKLRKPDTFPRDTMPQSTRDFLNSKWLDSSLDKFLKPDGHCSKYTPQLDDRQVLPLPLQEEMHCKESDRAMLKGFGTNHFRNFGSSFKSTNADGCQRTGVNLNFSSNRDTIVSSSLNDKLRHTSSTEVADSSCALQKDISPALGKGKEVVVQELSGAPRSQSKTSEHIDDIPMEIVELLAKNQYERCLPDREEEKQPPSQATTSVSKNALLIDLNETYDNSMDNTIRQPKPLCQNARNSDAATEEGLFLTGKQSSLEFFPTSYNVRFGVGNSPLTRDNQPSAIQFSGVVGTSCQWPTTMANQHNPSPSSFRVLRACNTCESVQQQQQYREASHPIWPSPLTSSPAHQPASLSMQNFMDHSTKLDHPNTRSLSFNDNGKQKLGFEGVGSRPMDTYCNESSIPAMHLLSLMDPRLRSNTPIDQSNSVKRPFSPVHQTKEFIVTQPVDCSKTAYSTKEWPFDLYGKTATPKTCRENFPITPPVGTTSISFQSEKSSAENAVFTAQASWNHHQEKKPKRKDKNFAPVYNNSDHQKPIFTSSSSDPGKFQLLGASDSMKLPLKFHMTDNAKKHKTKKAQGNNAVSACPPRSIAGPYVCSVNRNPADFTIPDAPGNVYMITGEDLKVRKHPGFRKKRSLCKQDALKQNNISVAPPNTENA